MNRIMKRILCLFLATIFALLNLSGCKPKPSDDPSGEYDEVSALNGIDLSLFSIVFSRQDDYSQRAAKYIKDEIKERTDIALSIKDDSNPESEYEIVIGETKRGISARLDADTQNTQFAILAEEKQIALEGDYFIIAAAAYFFVETYIPADNFSAQIPKKVSIHEPIVEEATNFILLIGDGMGVNQTLLFDVMQNNYDFGDKENVFYGYYLGSSGFSRTDSMSGTTDSAAGGTALSCGYKTQNGYVGQNRKHETIQSITELASLLGKATGVMSTEGSTGATPASFSAHANDRDLASEILEDQNYLKENYGTIIDCGFDYRTFDKMPELEDKVVSMLDKLDDNENGFFLMYEEAYIDKMCHNNDLKNTFLMLVRFNVVIARVMEYAFYHPNTFVLITADHETGKLLPNNSGSYSFNSINHSSADVPVFAYGYEANLFNNRKIENIQIPKTLAAFMGVKDFGDTTNKYGSLKK